MKVRRVIVFGEVMVVEAVCVAIWEEVLAVSVRT